MLRPLALRALTSEAFLECEDDELDENSSKKSDDSS
jgi:hypothetical protein